MSNMLSTIAPKSDQLNADDLIGGQTRTITITKVSLLGGDQPVSLSFKGDNDKPYKPCKSMRRVLVTVWGGDGNQYVGRSLTLFRDEKVTFGGAAVGGLRISHMSHIDEDITMALTAAKASRKPYTVKPLASAVASPSDGLTVQDHINDMNQVTNLEGLQFKYKAAYKAFGGRPEDLTKLTEAKDKRKSELTEGLTQ